MQCENCGNQDFEQIEFENNDGFFIGFECVECMNREGIRKMTNNEQNKFRKIIKNLFKNAN